ncbi:MAG TPA: rhodanese-like domain-containing protein, partial [Flavobacteriales bacterium]|nr:rhodanese-like domain-containing protein [Flavobacteriales bacterium]
YCMNKFLFVGFLLLVVLAGCNNARQTETRLTPEKFSQKINTTGSTQVVDVRTPEEYLEGHLENALNIDWNGNAFHEHISKLDRDKPVFVYCRSGRRSGEAAEHMRKNGFKEVYELGGGIVKWVEAGLPQEK